VNQERSKATNWPKDEFGRSEALGQLWWLVPLILGLLLVLPLARRGNKPEVVAYCAQDQVYAEPLFREFEKRTGIKVQAVYDSEAVKTVGLANRLMAERAHPQCDVFWGNEELRTRQLAAAGIFRPTNGWAAFGYRSRRIVINTQQVALAKAPKSLLELTNAIWRGKLVLAYPQFGTTSTHFHALRQFWGETAWEGWCRALAANKALLVDGNSTVVRLVGGGHALVGLTDSDDVAAGQREGLPVMAMPMNGETLLISNTAGVIDKAPHAEAAEKLFQFLQEPRMVERLVQAHALEGISQTNITTRTLEPDWAGLLRDLELTSGKLTEAFLR
jgi:iron(III) transport system substrate-binding protein